MRYLFIVFLVCLTVSAFTTADFGGVHASHSVALVNEQRRLLVELDAMNNPDPQHEQPGVIAVDVEGQAWIACGGDEYNGAEVWRPALGDQP